jgi:hypothetical protein
MVLKNINYARGYLCSWYGWNNGRSYFAILFVYVICLLEASIKKCSKYDLNCETSYCIFWNQLGRSLQSSSRKEANSVKEAVV